MASESELNQYLELAVDLARRAGKIAHDAVHEREKCFETKECSVDLVTETDKKVEDFIFSFLKEKYPSHRFIGEETFAGKVQLTDEPTWMVDPIDGTNNFVHAFPYSAVSIGLTVNKQPVVGVVYNFVLDQMFAARKGGGATMNGRSLCVSKCTEVNKAMVLTEMGYSRNEEVIGKKVDTMHKLAREPNPVLGLRSIGSAALSMCMVASGCADAYFEYGIHCWDVAAGDVIMREARGVTMYPTGEALDVMRRGVLCACTEDLAKKLVPYIHKLEQYYEPDH